MRRYPVVSVLLAALTVFCVSSLYGQTVTVTGCKSVADTAVAKSTDIAKLQADVKCDLAAPDVASRTVAASLKIRQDRLAILVKPTPTPTPSPAPSPILPDGFVKVASEDGSYILTSPSTVMYGAGDKFNTKLNQLTGKCDNATFGDPNVGVVKACYAKPNVPDPVPTPDPTPTPQPTSAGSIFPSPSLDGVAPVASGIDPVKYLTAVAPAEMNDPAEGAFRFLCEPSHNAYDDPIVYPGQPGKSHLHTFFGNTLADANSTYESLRKTGDSTCNNMLNRSAYWIPAMMNGRGKVVMPDYISVYYKGVMGHPECAKVAKACLKMPRGLRMIFGYNMNNPANSADFNHMWWTCDAGPAAGVHFANIPQAAKVCPINARIGMVVVAPECWDGKNLDSPDHRSHMAYEKDTGLGYTACDADHPFLLPRFTIGAYWTTDATLDRSGNESPDASTWYLASDRMPGMANSVPGTTEHSDWFGAWEDSILDTWTNNCISKSLSCTGGDLGNGTMLKQISGYGGRNATTLVDPPARP